MRTIERTNVFKRDYRRAKADPRHLALEQLLRRALERLMEDLPLPAANRDHPLSGKWNQCRECHLTPDLLLIYRKPDESVLQLVRLGSHNELFG